MLQLESPDSIEQESLLKCIWELIRAGDIVRAQELAVEHQQYHLAASLLGVSFENYVPAILEYAPPEEETSMEVVNAEDEEERLMKVGNSRRSLWMRTCFKYASHLAKNANNWVMSSDVSTAGEAAAFRPSSGASTVAILEMTIYAALSNNIPVLLQSPLLASYIDKLWVYLKSVHERDISHLLYKYFELKHLHSKLFAYSSKEAAEVETAFIEEQSRHTAGLETGSYEGVFSLLPSLDKSDSDESLLLLMQSSAIRGASCLRELLHQTLLPLIETRTMSPYMVRVFVHLLLWLYLSCPAQSNLRQIVSTSLLDAALGCYVSFLMAERRIAYVATYASLLLHDTRISLYKQWLVSLPSHSIHGSNAHDADSVFILSSAKQFFEADVIDFVREAVAFAREESRSPRGSSSFATPTKGKEPLPHQGASSLAKVPLASSEEASFEEDMMRVETLRWLSIEPGHRAELIRQINISVETFLRESHGQKIYMVTYLKWMHLDRYRLI